MADTDPLEDRDRTDIQVKADVKTPISVAVGVSFAIVVFVLTMFLSIGGSYLIGVSNRNSIQQNEKMFESTQRSLHIRELESGVRTSIPTCKALIALDDAKNGASNASQDPNSYGHRLAKAITGVVNDTGCRKLIHQVDAGVPLLKIAQQQEKLADGGSQ